MGKAYLINMTLSSLLARFKSSPESFEYSGLDTDSSIKSGIETIVWQPKVTLTDHDSTVIQDPNNNHAVIVQFNHHANEMSCYIFLKAPNNLSSLYQAKSDSSASIGRWFEKLRSPYRKFKKLKKLIMNKNLQRQHNEFLKKLSTVLPDALDKHIL